MGNFKVIIGKKLQKRRIEMGFKTQESLADKLGADTSMVTKWENGKHMPDPLYQVKMCELLGLPDDFFTEVSTVQEAPPSALDLINKRLEDLERKVSASRNTDAENLLSLVDSVLGPKGRQALINALRWSPESLRDTLLLPPILDDSSTPEQPDSHITEMKHRKTNHSK